MTTIFDSKAVARLAAHFCPIFHTGEERPRNYSRFLDRGVEGAPMLTREGEAGGGEVATTSIDFTGIEKRHCLEILSSLSLIVPEVSPHPPRPRPSDVIHVQPTPSSSPPLHHIPVFASGWTNGFCEFIDLVYVLTFFPVEDQSSIREAAVALRIFHDDAAPRRTTTEEEESGIVESQFTPVKTLFAEFDSSIQSTGTIQWRDATAAAIGSHVDPQHSQRFHLHLVDFAFSFAPMVAPGGALPGGAEEEGFLPPRVAVFNRPVSLHGDGMTYRHLPIMAVTRPPYALEKDDEDETVIYFYSGFFRVAPPKVAEHPPRYERACQGFRSVVYRFNTERPVEGRIVEEAEKRGPCEVEQMERIEQIKTEPSPASKRCTMCFVLLSDSAVIFTAWREILSAHIVYILGAMMLVHAAAICICH